MPMKVKCEHCGKEINTCFRSVYVSKVNGKKIYVCHKCATNPSGA